MSTWLFLPLFFTSSIVNEDAVVEEFLCWETAKDWNEHESKEDKDFLLLEEEIAAEDYFGVEGNDKEEEISSIRAVREPIWLLTVVLKLKY